mgnify:CR=1 FL=1
MEAAQSVCSPDGVEVVFSFLSNNEILVQVPPSFVVRTITLEVCFPLRILVPFFFFNIFI